MKYIYYLVLGLITISTQTIGQQQISYAYDASGNRISREIIIPPPIANGNNNNNSDENNATEITNKANNQIYYDYFNNSTVKLYPNPTYGKLIIELESKKETLSSSLRLYDQSGKLVYTSDNIGNQIKLDISDKSNGTYILKIQLGDSTREWKIIKM